jgi:hypothetical protein
MAEISICGTLGQGLDQACVTGLVKKYYQQFVVINHNDINKSSIIYSLPSLATPNVYNVAFSLKTGKIGYAFKADEGGRGVSITAEKTRDEVAGVQYMHKLNYTVKSTSERIKSILNSFDKGRYVVAAQLMNGDVEIIGLENGLSSGDYTYDMQGANGATVLMLQSDETGLESTLPLHFKSTDPNADFDAEFAN